MSEDDSPPGLTATESPPSQKAGTMKPPLPPTPAPVGGALGAAASGAGAPQLAFWQQLQRQRDPMRPPKAGKAMARGAAAAAVTTSTTTTSPSRGEAAATAAAMAPTAASAASAAASGGAAAPVSASKEKARIAELEARVQELRTTLWRANSRLGSLQGKYIEESGFAAEDDLSAAEKDALQTIFDENKTSAGGFPIEMVMPALGRALDWRLDCAPGQLCRQFVINRLQWSGLPLSFRELVRLFHFVRADPAEAVELPHLREEVTALREKLRHAGGEVARLRSLVASESKARVDELATLLPQLQELAALREANKNHTRVLEELHDELDDARSERLRAEHATRAIEQMLLAAQAKAVKVESELALALRKLLSERSERSVEVMRKRHEAELAACRAGFASEFGRQQKEIAALMQQMQKLL